VNSGRTARESGLQRPDEVVDVSTLLRVGGRGAALLYAVFVFALTTLTVLTLDNVREPAISLVALGITLSGALLLTRKHSDPFPLLWTWGVIFAGTASTSLVASNVVENDGPGREAWHIFGVTWMLFFLAMRGRGIAAWVGLVLTALVHVAWATGIGVDALGELERFQTSAAIVLVAILSTRALRRTSVEINELRLQGTRIAQESATAHTEGDVRHSRLTELRSLAVPMLRRIVESEGKIATSAEQKEFAVAEAAIRDTVRCRSLSTPQIIQAARGARLRGTDVTLIDDRGASLPTIAAMDELSQRVVWILEKANGGTVTVRLAPAGRKIAVSIVVTTELGTDRYDLNEDAQVVSSAPRTS